MMDNKTTVIILCLKMAFVRTGLKSLDMCLRKSSKIWKTMHVNHKISANIFFFVENNVVRDPHRAAEKNRNDVDRWVSWVLGREGRF